MMGLMVLIFFATYLLISIWAVHKATEWAKANNRKPWVWGGLTVFVMYNLVFWDLIPTLIAHKYYCSTQAGFWAYKSPEQWKVENPGVAEILEAAKKIDLSYIGEKGNSTTVYHLNNRFNWVVNDYQIHPWLPVYRVSEEVIDTKNNLVMSRVMGFWSGYFDERSLSHLKMWMSNRNCSRQYNATSSQLLSEFKNIGKGASND